MIMPATLLIGFSLTINVADVVPRYDMKPTCRAAVAQRRFRINMLHIKYVTLCTCTAQEKPARKSQKPHISRGEMSFATETSL